MESLKKDLKYQVEQMRILKDNFLREDERWKLEIGIKNKKIEIHYKDIARAEQEKELLDSVLSKKDLRDELRMSTRQKTDDVMSDSDQD